jgi:pimeloyl-ACP methyl ester carboxylesterase
VTERHHTRPLANTIPAPPVFALLREARIAVDLASGLRHAPVLLQSPRGSGEPVLLLPGFTAGDASTWPMRQCLCALGWNARGWGLGRNRGDAPSLLPRVIDVTERLASETGARVRLVGWSMGGFLAREAARDRPELIERVVTLGTPVIGGPKYTTAAPLFRSRGYDLDAIEREIRERARRPIEVPVTAIYSRRDGVVAWQACLDDTSRDVEHVEVESTHGGLGFDSRVWAIVADRLARARASRAVVVEETSADACGAIAVATPAG